MKIELNSKLEQWVQRKVQSGGYASATEVVCEALRLMEEPDELLVLSKEQVHQQIVEGYESLHRHDSVDGEEFFEALERREQAFLSGRKQRNP